MKRNTLFLAGMLLSLASFSQTKKSMQAYIMAGVKSFSAKEFNNTESVAPAAVPTIGGGVLWQFNRWQFGGEFNYLDGKKDTDMFGSILTGINSNILGGYTWDIGSHMTLSAQTGFGYSLHHLAVTDHGYNGTDKLNATIYHNFMISMPVSLMIQRTSPAGVLAGLRLGYHLPIGHNHWGYMEGDKTENYSSGTDGFYVQLTFGGLLTLKKNG